MSLYQTSVLKQHINLQDKDFIAKAYKKYVKYFLNPTIQDNIRSSKEEEYQGIFLTELFVNILDYTLKPKADYDGDGFAELRQVIKAGSTIVSN